MTKNNNYMAIKDAKNLILDYIEYKEEYADGEVIWRTKSTREFFKSLVDLLNSRGPVKEKLALLTVVSSGTLVEGRYNQFNMPLTKLCCELYRFTAKEYRRGYVSGGMYDMRDVYHEYRVHKNGHVSIDPYTH